MLLLGTRTRVINNWGLNMNKITLVFVCLVFICSCGGDNEVTHNFEILYEANPVTDAEKSIKNGDLRFMGLDNHDIKVPGVDPQCRFTKEKVKIIDGTSHFHQSYEVAKFNALAKVYAQYYNSRMSMYFDEKQLKFCTDNVDN